MCCVLCTADSEVQALARRVSCGGYLFVPVCCAWWLSPAPTIPVPSHLRTPDGRSASPCVNLGPHCSLGPGSVSVGYTDWEGRVYRGVLACHLLASLLNARSSSLALLCTRPPPGLPLSPRSTEGLSGRS